MKSITAFLTPLFVACFFMLAANSYAQTSVNGKTALGVWKTVDDETGRVKSHVEIYKSGNKYEAKIVQLLDKQTLKDSGEKSFADIKCTKCPAEHGKGQTMHGLKMIWDMEKESDKWAGGKIMDPKKGKIYTCTFWMDDEDSSGDTLKVRGWVGFFYRTQTWYRVK
jgi:uncharacterized protein (DUF2147 family)